LIKEANMKKIIVAACILTIVLFIFSVSSFAEGGAEEGCVVSNKGDIEDLVFSVNPAVELSLSDGLTVNVTFVEVLAAGSEVTEVTGEQEYIYNAHLRKGQKYSDNPGKGIIEAYTKNIRAPLEFEFASATVSESFIIKKHDISAACAGNEITVPKSVDLTFEVKGAILSGPELLLERLLSDYGFIPQPFNFSIEIDNGKPVEVIEP
jgi:hypothetical protein